MPTVTVQQNAAVW